MWPSRRSLPGQRNRERGGEGPKLPNFFLLPSLPLPFPDVFCESLFFRIKMASAVERVLESLEQKGDGNDGMSSGEESENVRIKSRGLKHPYEAQFYLVFTYCFTISLYPCIDFGELAMLEVITAKRL